MSDAIPYLSAGELAEQIKSGKRTSAEVTRAFVQRIKRHNPRLQALVVDLTDQALRDAEERDAELARGAPRGPLHGVPVTVKESFDVAGERTTVNFERLAKNVAREDSILVKRLREAGALILGKTNIPTMLSDFQSYGPLFPRACNPHDESRTPGGSTGGGGAAVAAGLTTFEVGSDIGGSIRVPSHFCGVFGLKPTQNSYRAGGHVPPIPGSRGGIVHMASTGPLARTVADLELAWSLLYRPDWRHVAMLPVEMDRPPRSKPADYTIAWTDEMGEYRAGNATRVLLEAFVTKLRDAGVRAKKEPFDRGWLERSWDTWGRLFGVVMGQDAPLPVRLLLRAQFGIKYGTRWGRGIAKGLELDLPTYARALGTRDDLVSELQARFGEVDYVVCPVAMGPAFAHCKTGAPIAFERGKVDYFEYILPFTSPFNTTGHPVLVVPIGTTSEGMPIGVQIVGPHHDERGLMRFGRLLEELGVACARPRGYEA